MIQTYELGFKNFLKFDDIKIFEGKVNFVVGKSGCGKSTLFKLLNKTEEFSSGDILFKGKSLTEYESISLRRQIKLVSQSPFLFSGSIDKNFDIYCDYCEHTRLSREEKLKFLCLTHADFDLESDCDKLSGGEKQRVYLAVCLSLGGDVFLLDEPTSALNKKLAISVLKNLVDFSKNEGKTLVIICHDSELAQMFSENTIEICGGGKNE